MSETCDCCYTSPCRCSEYLVGPDELLFLENSSGEYLNRTDARRLMATVKSLRRQTNSRPNDAVLEAAQKVADAYYSLRATSPDAANVLSIKFIAMKDEITALALLLPPKEGKLND